MSLSKYLLHVVASSDYLLVPLTDLSNLVVFTAIVALFALN